MSCRVAASAALLVLASSAAAAPPVVARANAVEWSPPARAHAHTPPPRSSSPRPYAFPADWADVNASEPNSSLAEFEAQPGDPVTLRAWRIRAAVTKRRLQMMGAGMNPMMGMGMGMMGGVGMMGGAPMGMMGANPMGMMSGVGGMSQFAMPMVMPGGVGVSLGCQEVLSFQPVRDKHPPHAPRSPSHQNPRAPEVALASL